MQFAVFLYLVSNRSTKVSNLSIRHSTPPTFDQFHIHSSPFLITHTHTHIYINTHTAPVG
jgi:hypothetical protein